MSFCLACIHLITKFPPPPTDPFFSFSCVKPHLLLWPHHYRPHATTPYYTYTQIPIDPITDPHLQLQALAYDHQSDLTRPQLSITIDPNPPLWLAQHPDPHLPLQSDSARSLGHYLLPLLPLSTHPIPTTTPLTRSPVYSHYQVHWPQPL